MFFIGIFGIDKKEVDLGKLTSVNCKICSNYSIRIIKQYDFFHFFFLPLFKWNEKYFGVCTNCNTIYEIKSNKGKDFEKGIKNAITYWDLNQLNTSYNIKSICPNCHNQIDENFQFCPYCGAKLY